LAFREQGGRGEEHRLALGTAGHIDHGKTALVRALTGVDTDRLPEEQARGITIELGFAPLDLGGGLSLSVVDVPGHEGLVRTMVAGASGIDLLLLVVAADEGVMPQTREHVAICGLLGVDRGVVALTKSDLVDAETRELAESEVEELLARTPLADAPVVAVSSVSGEGIESLRAALRGVVASAPPRTGRGGAPRLWIDRVFAMRGFGTVVTGTLVGGVLAVGDEVELRPSGRRARVRGLQSFGAPVERAEPGIRCAVNLQGVEVADAPRGEVVAPPGALLATGAADVALGWLAESPWLDAPMSVELLVGTTERRARLAPIGAGVEPGAEGFARLHVEGELLPLLPGDRFVVRGFARTALGGATLGGGTILDAAPPRRRLSDPTLARDLARLAQREPETDVCVRIERAGLAGAPREALVRETGLGAAVVDASLASLEAAGVVVASDTGLRLGGPAVERLESALLAALDAFHDEEPLRPGMSASALRGRLPENVPVAAAELALARLAERGALVREADLVRRAEHRAELSGEDRALAERIRSEAGAAGLEPPLLREWSERLGASLERLRDVLAFLERAGDLVRAPGDVWFDRAAVDALRSQVTAHLEAHGSLGTPTYKKLIGTTRKWAVPLMELFDEEKLTLRKGEARVLRRRS
jgi:selenocysteine-specific elongation factor